MRLFRPARRPLLAGLTALFALVLSMIGSVANAMPAVPKPAPPGAPALSPHAATDPPYDKLNAPWGPDVSGWQHPAGAGINWASVRAAGASFAFVKATEGTGYVSPYYRGDVSAARAQGLYVGAYHFAQPSLPLSNAATEANYFANAIGNVTGRGWLPPVLDLEVTGGLSAANVTAWAHTFLQTLQARTGRVPILYSGSWFYRGYMNNPSGFGQYPLWDALYNNSVSSPGTLFGDWTRTTFWQYTWQRPVPGITGLVDASYFHSSRAALAALANDTIVLTPKPYGAIGTKWAALGGGSGFLGKPVNNEYDVPGVAGARMQEFTGGTIYWSAATGAHEIHGGNLAKYRAAGNAANYGLPLTDESKTPDGIGRYNHFASGRSIYWTPSTHAHLIYGAIRVKWASLGWERSRLGYPTTDEYSVTGGRRGDFQHGSITWSTTTGTLTVVYR
jgi:GH25 family lysozyme M1 (1,4-beta-N-acetylmuramidase)